MEAKLQNDQKYPKWNRPSRQGQFLGFSDEHSNLVATVKNIKIGYTSPQYHIVFDEFFDTTFRRGKKTLLFIKFVTIFLISARIGMLKKNITPKVN